MTEIRWQNIRFLAESIASDTTAANALASSVALESMLGIQVSGQAQRMRAIALEIERISMHICDLAGMAVDLGLQGIASTLSRLRGTALGLADLLSGSRFVKGYICPGGVSLDNGKYLRKLQHQAKWLSHEIEQVFLMFLENTGVQQRLTGIGRVSCTLAKDFGLVGVVGRASGINYDARNHFEHATYPSAEVAPVVETAGDALARTKVRVKELKESFSIIDTLLDSRIEKHTKFNLPEKLPANSVGCGIVEAPRGELIHLLFTDTQGKIKRYIIKDPSFNNWTGMAIAARGNLIADFPICNKSFGLSYSGHDL